MLLNYSEYQSVIRKPVSQRSRVLTCACTHRPTSPPPPGPGAHFFLHFLSQVVPLPWHHDSTFKTERLHPVNATCCERHSSEDTLSLNVAGFSPGLNHFFFLNAEYNLSPNLYPALKENCIWHTVISSLGAGAAGKMRDLDFRVLEHKLKCLWARWFFGMYMQLDFLWMG